MRAVFACLRSRRQGRDAPPLAPGTRCAGLKCPPDARISPRTLSEDESNMATVNPIQFIQQVRNEVSKVTWPTRREVLLTTLMVFIMTALTATFFAIVDILIRQGLTLILSAYH